MEYLAGLLERYGGIALVIDYGHSGDKTDTFRVSYLSTHFTMGILQ